MDKKEFRGNEIIEGEVDWDTFSTRVLYIAHSLLRYHPRGAVTSYLSGEEAFDTMEAAFERAQRAYKARKGMMIFEQEAEATARNLYMLYE